MITLKHLSREFDIDPYRLRKILRKAFPHQSNQRWEWQPDDKELKDIRSYLKDKTNGT